MWGIKVSGACHERIHVQPAPVFSQAGFWQGTEFKTGHVKSPGKEDEAKLKAVCAV